MAISLPRVISAARYRLIVKFTTDSFLVLANRLSDRSTASAISANRLSAPPPPPPPELLEAAVIVTCADAERLASADDTAVIVTVAGEGTLAGAV